ncbi:MAG: hypothetical protein LQ347_006097 [Umbilicaria vellea]|nr:MAG: hypothetical protein LQ347_006097 [Umbilicaria vellea]
MDKEKLLRSKDRNGGETVVMDIDFEDRSITDFIPYKLPKRDTPSADTSGGTASKAPATNNASNDDSIGQTLKTLILFRPKDKLAPIFAAASSSTKNLYLATELRSIATSYIESENLVSPTNQRLVTLNPILANAVFDTPSSTDRDVLAKGTVPRDALLDRILSSCAPFHAILRNADPTTAAKPKAGAPPKITILVETRSGNKTVTKVSGLEAFHINAHRLGDELQKACASSTSVALLVGCSPKNPVCEVLVQGPQRDVVARALERRGVQRGWVEVVDKTKGKRR